MSAPPRRDFIALPLELALKRLGNDAGNVEVVKTFPTKAARGNGVWRIVRQSVAGGKTLLVAAEEAEGVAP